MTNYYKTCTPHNCARTLSWTPANHMKNNTLLRAWLQRAYPFKQLLLFIEGLNEWLNVRYQPNK